MYEDGKFQTNFIYDKHNDIYEDKIEMKKIFNVQLVIERFCSLAKNFLSFLSHIS